MVLRTIRISFYFQYIKLYIFTTCTCSIDYIPYILTNTMHSLCKLIFYTFTYRFEHFISDQLLIQPTPTQILPTILNRFTYHFEQAYLPFWTPYLPFWTGCFCMTLSQFLIYLPFWTYTLNPTYRFEHPFAILNSLPTVLNTYFGRFTYHFEQFKSLISTTELSNVIQLWKKVEKSWLLMNPMISKNLEFRYEKHKHMPMFFKSKSWLTYFHMKSYFLDCFGQ